MTAERTGIWDRIESEIQEHRTRDLVATLAALEDGTRKRLVAPLKALSRTPPGGLPPWDIFGGLALAGAAILPDARSTAAWLRRFEARDMVMGRECQEPVSLHSYLVEVLTNRNPPWLPRLVEIWSEGLRTGAGEQDAWPAVESLRARLDLDPIPSHGFVTGWFVNEWQSRPNAAITRIRADPQFAGLVPVALEIDPVLGQLQWDPGPFLSVAAAEEVDRDAVLDAALGRLQRGGRPTATNTLVRILRALEPRLEETGARVPDLIALLPSPASTAAGLAQELLFALHDAGLLDGTTLAATSDPVLRRSEKKLVRAQLDRLRRHAATHPDEMSLVIRATAVALANPAVDLQRAAVQLVTSLTARTDPLDEDALTAVRDGADYLPPDLAAQLNGFLGQPTDLAALSPVLAPTLPTTAAVRLAPASSVDELFEEFLGLVRAEGNSMRGHDLERVIEAIPRYAGTPSFRRRAAALLDEEEHAWVREHFEYLPDHTVRRGLYALLAAACGSPLPDPRHNGREEALQWTISQRLFSLANALARDPAVRSIAFPTWTTGSIAADDLAERLATAAVEGWQPDPIDLEQARIRTETTDVPTPSLKVGPVPEYRDTTYDGEWMGREPAEQTYLVLPMPLAGDTSRGSLWTLLTRIAYPGGFRARWDPDDAYDAWPLVLPHHRDLLAAHLTPELTRARNGQSAIGTALVALAAASGTVGPATLAAFGYGLAAKGAETQAAAVDGLLALVARDHLDTEALADTVTLLVRTRSIVLTRTLGPIGDLARAGAAHETWQLLRSMLERLLTDPPAGVGLADLLALAAEVMLLDPRNVGPVPGLAELAARRGASRQLVEARRLRDLLPG